MTTPVARTMPEEATCTGWPPDLHVALSFGFELDPLALESARRQAARRVIAQQRAALQGAE